MANAYAVTRHHSTRADVSSEQRAPDADAKQFPADELRALYHERWEIELGFGEIKTDLLERMETIPCRGDASGRRAPRGARAYQLRGRGPLHRPGVVLERRHPDPGAISQRLAALRVDNFGRTRNLLITQAITICPRRSPHAPAAAT